MAWNPDTYNKFKSERSAPFFDLLDLVEIKTGLEVIDLGCGTGELTSELQKKLPSSVVVGIDSSKEMLDKANQFVNDQLQFKQAGIVEQIATGKKWDVIFSNAAIQWVEDHQVLLPKLIGSLKQGGQLAIQIPAQHHNRTNILLDQLADQSPYQEVLKNWKRISPVLEIDVYSKILFENGSKTMTIFEKVYPLVLNDCDALFEWVSGTALIPYLERLPEELKDRFKADYKNFLRKEFRTLPVFYPFKRILFAATF